MGGDSQVPSRAKADTSHELGRGRIRVNAVDAAANASTARAGGRPKALTKVPKTSKGQPGRSQRRTRVLVEIAHHKAGHVPQFSGSGDGSMNEV